MFCINCFHTNTAVGNSRANKKRPQVWRRRICSKCGHTFTTYERVSLTDSHKVTYHSATRPFNLGKLIISISKAFTHNPEEGSLIALELAQTVEDTLIMDKSELTPQLIATITYNTLRRFDELAAIQYAARHQLISSIRKPGRPSLREHGPQNDESPSQ